MIFLVLELIGVACALSTIVFVPVGLVSRPDLEEELTEDQSPRHRWASLHLDTVTDNTTVVPLSAAPQPQKMKMSRLSADRRAARPGRLSVAQPLSRGA